MKHIIVAIDLLYTDILVCWDCKIIEILDLIKEKYSRLNVEYVRSGIIEQQKNYDEEEFSGSTLRCDGPHSIIWLKNKPYTAYNISTLVHEATHSAIHLMTKLKMPIEKDITEELMACICDNIVRKVLCKAFMDEGNTDEDIIDYTI